MIDPAPIIAQIKSLNLFAHVGGAAQLMAVAAGHAPGDGPNAYVVPLADRPDIPRGPGGPQVVTASFAVQIMIRRINDIAGEAAMAKLFPIQRALHKGMMGWVPVAGCEPLWWSGAGLSDLATSALWWQEVFTTRYGIFPTIPGF